MGAVVVGVIGTLLGVLIGGAVQHLQALGTRKWQKEDSLSTTKQAVYAEYLRSISASYAQTKSGHRRASEDANLLAAAAQIEVLCRDKVSGPARDLVSKVIAVHHKIAAGTGVVDVEVEAEAEDVDRRRYELIDLFRDDLGLGPRRQMD
jgi:hypothetical protein